MKAKGINCKINFVPLVWSRPYLIAVVIRGKFFTLVNLRFPWAKWRCGRIKTMLVDRTWNDKKIPKLCNALLPKLDLMWTRLYVNIYKLIEIKLPSLKDVLISTSKNTNLGKKTIKSFPSYCFATQIKLVWNPISLRLFSGY